MYCPNCGARISDKAKFCPRCGAALSDFAVNTNQANQPRESNPHDAGASNAGAPQNPNVTQNPTAAQGSPQGSQPHAEAHPAEKATPVAKAAKAPLAKSIFVLSIVSEALIALSGILPFYTVDSVDQKLLGYVKYTVSLSAQSDGVVLILFAIVALAVTIMKKHPADFVLTCISGGYAALELIGILILQSTGSSASMVVEYSLGFACLVVGIAAAVAAIALTIIDKKEPKKSEASKATDPSKGSN